MRILPAMILLLTIAATAVADVWDIEPGDGTRLRFTSDAPLEVIIGRTGQVTGSIEADPAALAGSVAVFRAGEVKPLTVAADLALDADGVLTVVCTFPVVLADHDIPRPELLFMKLAEEQIVDVTLRAVPSPTDHEESP